MKWFQIARQLVGLYFSNDEPEMTIEISEDQMAKLTLVPTVAAVAADKRDDRLERAFVREHQHAPVVLRDELLRNLDRVRPILKRCGCHSEDDEVGPVWEPRRFYGGSKASKWWVQPSQLIWPGETENPNTLDEMALILPWICPIVAAKFGEFSGVRTDPPMVLPFRGEGIFLSQDRFTHRPGCQRHLEPSRAAFTNDVLGPHFRPEGSYGYERSLSVLRCVWCFRDQVHYLNPAIWDEPWNRGQLSPGNSALKCCYVFVRHLHLLQSVTRVVHLTSWNSSFGPLDNIPPFGIPLFVLVENAADEAAVRAINAVPLTMWIVGNGRSLGNMRYFLAACAPVGFSVVVTDAYLKTPSMLELSRPALVPVECSPTHLNAVCADMSIVVGGATQLPVHTPITRYAALGPIWGLEEAAMTRSTYHAYRADVRMAAFNLPWDILSGSNRYRPLVFRSMVSDRWAEGTISTRAGSIVVLEMVKRWSSEARAGTAWWAAAVLPVGKFEDRGPVPEQYVFARPDAERGSAETLSAAIANDVGVVNWYTFGSYGDLVPIRALARRLKGWGIKVNIVRCNTDEQGIEVLAAVESGRTLDAAPLFLQGMLSAMTAPGVVFGPPEFIGVSVGVSLRPPPSIIYPADFGMGWLANFFLEAWMRTWAPMVNVGAYRGLHWLPRSADGVTFLRKSTNRNRPIDIMLAWGSSTIAPPHIPGAVLVQPGDHYAQFEKAKIVIGSGASGVVQTAGAAGCRVIAGTSVLDRRYRDPLDAARGIQVGADPDAVMLMLLPSTPKIWLWAWNHSWRMFVRAVYWSMPWVWMPAVWLLCALAFKTFVFIVRIPRVRLVFTTSFAGSLLATSLSSVVPPFWAMVLSPHIETLVRYLLDHLGLTYTGFFIHVVHFVAQASASTTTWAVLFLGGGWWSLLAFAIVNMSKVPALLSAEVVAILIRPIASAPEGGWATLSVTWAFEGSNVPIFHTRMLNADRTRVYEGHWTNPVRGLGTIYRIRASDYVNPHPTEWLFPTRIPWSVFENAPEFTAPYSPLWNCQSALLATTRGMWVSFGVAGVVLFPMMLFTGIAALLGFVGCLIAVLVIDLLPGFSIMLEAAGLVNYLGPIRRVSYGVLQAASTVTTDWYGTVMALTVGFATGWGQPDDVNKAFRQMQAIGRAKDIKAMTALLQDQPLTDVIAIKMWQMKMNLLTGRAH